MIIIKPGTMNKIPSIVIIETPLTARTDKRDEANPGNMKNKGFEILYSFIK